ncbi:HNH endonuclease signature motif containing protein [Phycicoccus avicenniae]|nr:DUF222 domain-containing protein [Phycicoccus avicenniae]
MNVMVRDVGPPAAVASVRAFRDGLAFLDPVDLTDADRVDLIDELERTKRAAAAAQARMTDALRRSVHRAAAPGPTARRDAARSLGSQVALARRESPGLGDRFVGTARALVHEMPATMALLERGLMGERHVTEVVKETAALSAADRGEVDRRLADALPRLGWRGAGRAARRVAAELDAASVVARTEAAVASRRVSVRPAPDGMAYLTVLGPLTEVVGAYAALRTRAAAVVSGQVPDEAPHGRGAGAVAADTALRLLSGRAIGQVQPVEVHLVMTDRALLGTGDGSRTVSEPARIPGHGSVPAPVARSWLRGAGEGSVWLRRLYGSPDGRDLVALDSRRRLFGGLLRRMLVLRDDVCVTPWCDAPIVQGDHTHPARDAGDTTFTNGSGACARCNLVKEAPGWGVQVVRGSSREIQVTTPTGHRHRASAPPVLGWGSDPPSRLEQHLAGLVDAA